MSIPTDKSRQGWRTYYGLTKPGIVYGNGFTALAGFMLGADGQVDIGKLAWTLIGVSLVIASAGVFNNFIDRGIDAKMTRTRQRALAAGYIQPASALIFGSCLAVTGLTVLLIFTNALTAGLALLGMVLYLGPYGLAKRNTVQSTLIGSLSGALPPVIGYAAATDNLDKQALALFLILVSWQMAHFYAIAIYRRDDYAAAGLPVLTVKKSSQAAKRQIVAYILIFGMACLFLTLDGATGKLYPLLIVILVMLWLARAIKHWREIDTAWGRMVFKASLLVLISVSLLISFNHWLP